MHGAVYRFSKRARAVATFDFIGALSPLSRPKYAAKALKADICPPLNSSSASSSFLCVPDLIRQSSKESSALNSGAFIKKVLRLFAIENNLPRETAFLFNFAASARNFVKASRRFCARSRGSCRRRGIQGSRPPWREGCAHTARS